MLSRADVETLKALVEGFDPARRSTYGGDTLNFFNREFNTLRNDNERDFPRFEGLNFSSLLLDEIERRIESEKEKTGIISEKEAELEEVTDKVKQAEKEKAHVEEKLFEKSLELEKKQKELSDKKSRT